MAAILETQDLTVGYRQGGNDIAILRDLNLSLQRGRLVVLLGANGAGKSTLLRALTCAAPPLSGTIMLDGRSLADIPQLQRARLIGLVSTDRIQAGALTLYELVALGRQPHTGFLGRLSESDHEAVKQAIDDVGIAHKAQSYVAELSDGERQKAMIARALAQATPVIVLDEPTAFLDVASRIETMHLLHQLTRERDKAVLLSSHDVSQALLLADELWLITHDRRMIVGNTKELIESGAMNQIFANRQVTFNPDILDYQYTE
ncbi:MAG: ABC transporter ATP-binding protein [Muribaculaceae bacterium]|jgi:iron complex transport system ATP-binding protein|nr:ABC transporter ATP-binding protein [Muribaculaceae bacterium]